MGEWAPVGSAFAESLLGIKDFQDFKKTNYTHLNEGVEYPSLDHNKMERRQMHPIGPSFAEFLWGIKLRRNRDRV